MPKAAADLSGVTALLSAHMMSFSVTLSDYCCLGGCDSALQLGGVYLRGNKSSFFIFGPVSTLISPTYLNSLNFIFLVVVLKMEPRASCIL